MGRRSEPCAVRTAWLVVASMLSPGCYAAHGGSDADAGVISDAALDTADGLDAGPPCVEPGTYDTPYVLESATPVGCDGSLPDTMPITFPLEEEFAGDPRYSSLTLTSVGTCQWAFEYVEDLPFPGWSFRSWGVLGVGADGFFGRVESRSTTDPGGGCDTVLVLGGGVPSP